MIRELECRSWDADLEIRTKLRATAEFSDPGGKLPDRAI